MRTALRNSCTILHDPTAVKLSPLAPLVRRARLALLSAARAFTSSLAVANLRADNVDERRAHAGARLFRSRLEFGSQWRPRRSMWPPRAHTSIDIHRRFVMSTKWKPFVAVAVLLSCFVSNTVAKSGEVSTDNSVTGGASGTAVDPVSLSNGNVVIVNSGWNGGYGAVTCLTPLQYQSGDIVVSAVNSLVGSSSTDAVGSKGVVELANGDYVVVSPNWSGNRGAVTWVDGDTCLPYNESSAGVAVSSLNSLVGATGGDQIGSNGVTALTNGNYVVASSSFDNGSFPDAGAVTWRSGSGSSGVVSAGNSLVGGDTGNQIGSGGVKALTNGNYVVVSPLFDSGSSNIGAVTWGDGTTVFTGTVSSGNSMVGATAEDRVGSGGVTALTNGNYVIASPNFDGDASNTGAVTWRSGTTVSSGALSSANSLVGPASGDQVGNGGVTALSNGNYVVSSTSWDNNGAVLLQYGAVTWMDGTTLSSGTVSSANSTTGTRSGDQVGSGGIVALTNGNYVILSPNWDTATQNLGAITWKSGTTSTSGNVTTANSLYGASALDGIGSGGGIALSNGNYVVLSRIWNNTTSGVVDAGAVTWGDGTTLASGTVDSTNSLSGSTGNDFTSARLTALSDGNYVVSAPMWDDGATANIGAVKWMSGTATSTGTLSSANSLVGTVASDMVGQGGAVALDNGRYAVISSSWDNGGTTDAGAVTLSSAGGATTGTLSSGNSLVGTTTQDRVGAGGVLRLDNGGYLVSSPFWNNTTSAVTWSAGVDTGISITETGATAATEGGSTDSYVIALASQPSDTVTVTMAFDGSKISLNGDADGAASISFTAGNWDEAQAVTIAAVDDAVDEDDENTNITQASSSSDGSYDNLTLATIPVLVSDNDTAGIVIAPANGSIGVTEGGATDTYTLVLTSQPTADVTIMVSPDAQVTTSPTPSMTFTSLDWDTPKIVTVTAVNDGVIEGMHSGTITHSAAGGDYTGLSIANVTASITDNDAVGVSIAETGGTSVAEGGATDTYTLVLTSQPTADVTITVSPDAQVTTSPTPSLTFTALDWDAPKTVTVTAVNDGMVESAHSGTITHSAVGGEYTGVGIASVTASITDDDTGGATITPSGGTTSVAESGATDSYDVVLIAQPSGDVTITVGPDSQLGVSGNLLFTSGNWNVAQTVTVNAVDDAVAEGTHIGSITHAPSGGGYDGVSIANLVADIGDNDVDVAVDNQTLGTPVAGRRISYSVLVDNLTATDAADVTFTFSPGVPLTNVTWSCVAEAGAWCPASGSGAPAHSISLAADTGVLYDISADVPAGTPDATPISTTAMISVAAPLQDIAPGNDTDSTQDTVVPPSIFRSGFEDP
jgi:hypothetical protein